MTLALTASPCSSDNFASANVLPVYHLASVIHISQVGDCVTTAACSTRDARLIFAATCRMLFPSHRIAIKLAAATERMVSFKVKQPTDMLQLSALRTECRLIIAG